ncbi:MAG TPA: carboxypeptidase-like regulatory domain-containing protein [Candidatus Baltobacteraceae bacterium]|nr:carboxypeptidase-like regulatory domain-containing protein [Candidatus Baltobacteraceae bacterium]
MAAFMLLPNVAFAGTTGNITGTVIDSAGKPIADVKVTASSLSQTQTGTTDSHGYYALVNLLPDTYNVSFQKSGLQAASTPGITVTQDQNTVVNETMQAELKTIANVRPAARRTWLNPTRAAMCTPSAERS